LGRLAPREPRSAHSGFVVKHGNYPAKCWRLVSKEGPQGGLGAVPFDSPDQNTRGPPVHAHAIQPILTFSFTKTVLKLESVLFF
jgi:hypothetical protein